MSDGLTLPLAVFGPNGNLLGALLMNKKSFNKSIENHELWVVHPLTDRVLPLEGVGFHALSDKSGSWYQALLDHTQAEAFQKSVTAQEETLAAHPGKLTSGHGESSESTLEKLATVVAQRHRDMPEGSYTTHLFQKGEEKIRKKTGEEAIELVLAKEPDEIVYEAADLIYHMMVLLEFKGIPVKDVLSELESRMK